MNKEILKRNGVFHSDHYSPIKSAHFPMSFIIKAKKL